MTFDATTTTGHHIVMDAAPPEGDNRGPKPIELLLTALAGCTGMDVLAILQKKREPVEAFEVYVEGRRAPAHPMVYTEVDVVYRITGNVKAESVERAIQLSEEKYCGVSATLQEIAKINHRYEILAGQPLDAQEIQNAGNPNSVELGP
jgi:putative redox protein